MRSAPRCVVAAGAGPASPLVLQVAVFPHLAWEGIVPNLCLLVVVAAALVRGPAFAATLGFFAGLLLDLAPPADHVAGRWALALVVVGYLAGRMRQDARPDRDARWSPPSRPARSSAPRSSRFSGMRAAATRGRRSGEPLAGDPGRRALGRAADPVRAAAA